MNITEAINALVKKLLADAEPGQYDIDNITIDNIRYYINCGYCEEFAGTIVKQIEGAEAYWGDNFDADFWGVDIEDWVVDHAAYHCFIVYKGRYYDSEAPEGVDHPKDLPLYQKKQEFAKTGKWNWQDENFYAKVAS
jgi:hypothetical protein